ALVDRHAQALARHRAIVAARRRHAEGMLYAEVGAANTHDRGRRPEPEVLVANLADGAADRAHQPPGERVERALVAVPEAVFIHLEIGVGPDRKHGAIAHAQFEPRLRAGPEAVARVDRAARAYRRIQLLRAQSRGGPV